MGWLEKRGPNTWRMCELVGRDSTGKRIVARETITASSEREAKKQLEAFCVQVRAGNITGPVKYTFQEFAEKWLEEHAERNLAPHTVYRYRDLLQQRVFPEIGHIKLEKVRPMHLIGLYSKLQKDGARKDSRRGGLSARTVTQIHRIISSVFSSAVQWQVVPDNPASRVKPPKIAKTPALHYDEEQTAAMLTALELESDSAFQQKMLVLLAVTTGLRRGELLGLEWRHIDFSDGSMRVEQSSLALPGRIYTGGTKNQSSSRIVEVPAFVLARLRSYKARQNEHILLLGDKWEGQGRLFTSWEGKPMHPMTITSWFSRFLTRHDLPAIPFHSLRHTAATLLIAQNVHAKVISAQLGHSSISTTMNVYGHALKSAAKGAAEKMDALLAPKENKRKA